MSRASSSPAFRIILPWLGGGAVVAAYAALVWAEHRRPLRPETQPKLPRDLRNLALAVLNGAMLSVIQTPVIGPLTRWVEHSRWGLLKRLGLPVWLEVPLAVALMDYTLYLWHVWTHKGPLWRFHQVHHVDFDMDATTAVRFHLGEMAASVPYRALQVLLIGVGPRTFAIWQGFLMACITFHHSNLRLPVWLERAIAPVLVTPRNHGVHHSVVKEETDSNWSSGLTIWDQLHGTLRLDVPQDEIEIGVPAYRDPAELTLRGVLAMPFGAQRASWRWRDGERPRRQAHSVSEFEGSATTRAESARAHCLHAR